MLHFSLGQPIARIKGGRYDGKVLHIYDPDKKCCTKCGSKCENKKCCEDCQVKKGGCMTCKGGNMDTDILTSDRLNLLPPNYFKKRGGKINLVQLEKLKNAIIKQKSPADNNLENLYNMASKDLLI